VSARFLVGVFDSVYLVALAAWVGSILFFLFGLSPVLFKARSPEEAGKLEQVLYSRSFTWGSMACAIALPAFVAVPLCYPEYRGPAIAVGSLIILACALTMLYAANSLAPAMSAAREAGPAGRQRFQRLHVRSVLVSALSLAAGLGLLVAYANRPVPRTSGIRQLTPDELSRVDAELGPVIEQVEAKYGFRPGPAAKSISPGAAVDGEAIKEIESYYEQKRQRELARRGLTPTVPRASENR
jgi:hypothetical protein